MPKHPFFSTTLLDLIGLALCCKKGGKQAESSPFPVFHNIKPDLYSSQDRDTYLISKESKKTVKANWGMECMVKMTSIGGGR